MIDRDIVERHKRTVRLTRDSGTSHGPVRDVLVSPQRLTGIDAILARAVTLDHLRQIDGSGRGGFSSTMRHAR